jgi:Zn-dependent protease
MQPDRPHEDYPSPADGERRTDASPQYGWSGRNVWSAPQWHPQGAQPPVYPPPPEYFGGQPQTPSNWHTGYSSDEVSAGAPRPPAAPSGRAEAAGCAVGAALLALLSKVTIIGKFLIPFGSALLSIGAYALLFGGWQVGAGIVVLLFIHEMGHFFIIRAKGLPASLPVFIPLVGAYVALRRMPQDARDEAEIAIAGPVAGAIAGAVCFAIFQETGQHLFLLLAYFSFLINLLNLIPVSPLDGGRIVGAISRWIWPLGLVLVAVAFLYTRNLLLLLLIWFGLVQTMNLFRATSQMSGYYRIGILPRAYITLLYVGLAAGLGLGFYVTEQLLVTAAGRLF